jgi:hypothetical protein
MLKGSMWDVEKDPCRMSNVCALTRITWDLAEIWIRFRQILVGS